MKVVLFQFFILISFGIISPNIFAKVNYISFHDLRSTSGNPLELTLNIVETYPDVALRFVLVANGTEKLLRAKRVNQYLISLKDSAPLFSDGAIAVYESEGENWEKIKTIQLPEYKGEKTNQKNFSKLNSTALNKKHERQDKLTDNNDNLVKAGMPLMVAENCTLERAGKETLWSIASRYKLQWKTNIYGAMVAIYRENITKFLNNNIENLMDHSELNCPRKSILLALDDKIEMKALFRQIIKQPEKNNLVDESQNNNVQTCQLTREKKETLWSIASRYKSTWKTSVYGAMVAIYRENKVNMINGKIDDLIGLSRLNCPRDSILKALGDKAEMKAEFNLLR